MKLRRSDLLIEQVVPTELQEMIMDAVTIDRSSLTGLLNSHEYYL